MSESVGLLSRVLLFATVDRQAPLPVEFSGREYWSGLPFPSPGDLSDPAVELGDLALQVDCLVAQMVKRLPSMQETLVQSLDQEDPLEKAMATHSSTLA